jgi:hypothetical protein
MEHHSLPLLIDLSVNILFEEGDAPGEGVFDGVDLVEHVGVGLAGAALLADDVVAGLAVFGYGLAVQGAKGAQGDGCMGL